MYDRSDPRSALADTKAKAVPLPDKFDTAQVARFYEEAPQETAPKAKTWYVRGQNFLVAYTKAEPGAVLTRDAQPDEYGMLIHDRATGVVVGTPKETVKVDGHSVTFVPPGKSSITLPNGGEVVRFFSTRSADLVAKCSNAKGYAQAHPTVAPLVNWPDPPGGFKVRSYSADVPAQPGRFGRIFRCTTLMINYLDPHKGPRDVTKLSPHHHDDFEQVSLAVEGSFIHHLRWPWTTNMNAWLKDEAIACGAPSVTVIPPPAIHTSRAMDKVRSQLIDVFSPPRMDFSEKPGWVLNAADYPMPSK